MSPISHGVMYASANQGVNEIFALRILFIGKTTQIFEHRIDVLHNYLIDIGRSNVGVKIYTPTESEDVHLEKISLDITSQVAIEEFAKTNYIDVIYDPKSVFGKRKRFKLNDFFAITTTDDELVLQIESYLTGNSIPWIFREPIWHIGWIYKYTRRTGLSKKAFSLISIGQEKNYSGRQLEYTRALSNKIMHVEYVRERLNYYLQLKRRAHRANNRINTFSFELNYELTNYSLFICSSLDIVSRLLNDLYDLSYGKYVGYGIEKDDFIKRLAQKRKTLANIFSLKKYQTWATWMKERRNNITHESNLYMTPLVIQKKKILSDAELEKRVDEAYDWDSMRGVGIESEIQSVRAVIKQKLELELNYDEVVTDMMTLERKNRTTGQEEKLIVFPLRSIDEDFNKLSDIIIRVIDDLSHARKRS